MGRRSFQRATQPPPPVAAWSVASREVTGPHLRDAELTASTAISRSCERLNFSTDLFCDPPRISPPSRERAKPRLHRSIEINSFHWTRGGFSNAFRSGGGRGFQEHGSKKLVHWSEVGKMDRSFEQVRGNVNRSVYIVHDSSKRKNCITNTI